MKNPENFNRVCVVGIDGSGKSTAANEAALKLSCEYPYADIRVTDSDGISTYQYGELMDVRFPNLNSICPEIKSSKMEKVLRMGAFILARQSAEQFFAHSKNSLTISVRDPYRLDPTAYFSVYCPERLKHLSIEDRLFFFDSITSSPHPSLVVLLEAKLNEAIANVSSKPSSNPHETPLKMAVIARDLPEAVDTYDVEYDVPSTTIYALRPKTSEILAEVIEEFVPNRTQTIHSVKVATDSCM